jgi:hypothetical protein
VTLGQLTIFGIKPYAGLNFYLHINQNINQNSVEREGKSNLFGAAWT